MHKGLQRTKAFSRLPLLVFCYDNKRCRAVYLTTFYFHVSQGAWVDVETCTWKGKMIGWPPSGEGIEEFPSMIRVHTVCNCNFTSALEMQIKQCCQLAFSCQTFHCFGRLYTAYNVHLLPALLRLGAWLWGLISS